MCTVLIEKIQVLHRMAHSLSDPKDSKEVQELTKQIVEGIQRELHAHNQLVQKFLTAKELLRSEDKRPENVNIIIPDVAKDQNPGVFNKPTSNEIAMIVEDENATNPKGILITGRKRPGDNYALQTLGEGHRSVDGLTYVLFHPNGDDGWSYDLKKMKSVTVCDYYKYKIMVRKNEDNPFLMGGRLLMQYLCDQWLKVERGVLRWHENPKHQKKLRAEFYKGAMDAMASGIPIKTIGKKVILPASFHGLSLSPFTSHLPCKCLLSKY